MDDLVSVVITTYKRPVKILERAVRSVLAQTHSNMEIFIVNDAPQEKALVEEIRAFIDDLGDARINYIVQSKNMGANVARNAGLRAAHGNYIAFLDDDDEWEETKLSRQLEQMGDDTAIVSGPFIIKSGRGESEYRISIPNDPLSAILEDNYIGSTSFSLLRTDFVRECGGFDESLPRCQEYELWIRLLSKYEIRYVNEPVGYYYYSDDSFYRNSPDKFIRAIELIIQKHKDLYALDKRVYSNRLIFTARHVISMKRWGVALKFKLRAMSADILNPNVWKTWVVLEFVKRPVRYVIKKMSSIHF